MSSLGNDFLLALQFLTRLPLPMRPAFTPEAQARSLLYYPLVGALIGCLLWLAGSWLPDGSVVAALLLLLWVGLTGGLHLDGLADSADAWCGGQGDRERALAIMKDPASGPLGVSAVVLLLLLKYAALDEWLGDGGGWALIAAPLLGRCAVLSLLSSTPYLRRQGLASAMVAHLPRAAMASVLAAALGVAWLLWLPWWAILAVLLLWSSWHWLSMRWLGGLTGDLLGAAIEVTEAVVLLLLVWR